MSVKTDCDIQIQESFQNQELIDSVCCLVSLFPAVILSWPTIVWFRQSETKLVKVSWIFNSWSLLVSRLGRGFAPETKKHIFPLFSRHICRSWSFSPHRLLDLIKREIHLAPTATLCKSDTELANFTQNCSQYLYALWALVEMHSTSIGTWQAAL